MNGMLLGKNAGGDTVGVIRMHMNPTVKETLQVFMHDPDKVDSLSFYIEGMDSSVNPSPGRGYDSLWVYTGADRDTVYNGFLRISDNRGGNAVFPLEIVIYREVHSLWWPPRTVPTTPRR